MVFSSISFLLYFFPVFLLVYHLTPKPFKNFVILISSIIFYSWGGPKFIFVILGTTFVDFFIVRAMDKAIEPRKRTSLLILSLCINLGLLFYFKYFNFFVDNVNDLLKPLGAPAIDIAKILLPIGISFYTFETITYVVDVYRKVHKPLDNFWEYQLYIILFPKLIAGPIVRYHDISDQIKNHVDNESMENKLTGFTRFCIGLGKKVLIANVMGAQADAVFAVNPHTLDTISAWIGALAYTFQIYFDFSGYSDMAIGICQILGFKLPENFNNPYTSTSVTDFWRRWHMTLGAWMRNYLYIPLGGNRVNSKTRLYFNLWLVFLASGLWHGAAWTFVFWGAYHGFFLVLERSFLLKQLEKLPKMVGMIYTFFFIVIGWVFFRADSISNAFAIVNKMFAFQFGYRTVISNNDFSGIIYVAIFFSFFVLIRKGQLFQNKIYFEKLKLPGYLATGLLSIVLLVLSVAAITGSDFNPFIYFRF